MLDHIHNKFEVDYSKNAFIQYDAANTLIYFIANECGNNILDVGCGSGSVTKLFLQSLKPYNLHAVDKSKIMIEEAKKKLIGSNITFEHIEIEHLAKTKQYDTVLSNSSFQWFSDYKLALDNIKNSLTKDGCFYIQTSYKDRWCPEFIDIINNIKRKNNSINHIFKYHKFPCMHLENESEYRKFLTSHGFFVKKIMVKSFKYKLSSKDALKVFESGPIKAYTSTEYFTRPIDYKLINIFYNQFVKFVEDQKYIQITYPRIFIQCQKQ